MTKIPMLGERVLFRSPNINVGTIAKIAKIEGHFTADEFTEAINKTAEKHILAKSTIQIDDDNNAWYIPDSGSVGIEFHDLDEGYTWLDWYNETDAVPFDFLHGPLIKVCVFFDGQNAVIIVLGHHIIGDAIAYINFVGDILYALDNRFDAALQIPFMKNNFSHKIRTGFFEKKYIQRFNKAWEKNRHVFSEAEYHTFFAKYREKFPPGMYLSSIEGDTLNSLLKKAKLYGVTINQVITAAFVSAMDELPEYFPHGKVHANIALTFRRELSTEMNKCMGNFSSFITPVFKYNSKKTFLSNLKHISAITKRTLNDYSSRYHLIKMMNKLDKDLLESALFAVYGDYENPVSFKVGEILGGKLKDKNLGIANLGIQKFEDYTTLKILDFIPVPPAVPSNLLEIAALTINDKLNFCLRYNTAELKDEQVKIICTKALALMCNESWDQFHEGVVV